MVQLEADTFAAALVQTSEVSTSAGACEPVGKSRRKTRKLARFGSLNVQKKTVLLPVN